MITKGKKVVVIGLGVYGGALTAHLAMKGAQVIGIDRLHPPHDEGSSTGESRMVRFSSHEGAPFVHTSCATVAFYQTLERNPAIKAYLEAKYGDSQLFTANGTLLFGPTQNIKTNIRNSDNAIWQSYYVAMTEGVEHSLLGGPQLREKFPAFHIAEDELEFTMGYHEHGSGKLSPERCVDAQLELARLHGATLRMNAPVAGISDSAVTLEDGEKISADYVVVCAGPWVKELLPDLQKNLRLTRQVSCWFSCDDPSFTSEHYPNFARWVYNPNGVSQHFYGFPGTYVKVAKEDGREVPDNQYPHNYVSPEEECALFEFVSPSIPSLQPKAVKATASTYTMPLSNQFLIAAHPDIKNVHVVSSDLGHGFKHAASLMDALADDILGRPRDRNIDMEQYSMEKFLRGLQLS